MFAHMHDTARVNSSTIFALNQGKDPIKEKSSEYTYNLWWDQSNPPLRYGTKFSWLQKSSKKLLLCWIVLYHSQSCTKMMDLLLVLRKKVYYVPKGSYWKRLKKKKKIPFPMSRHFVSLVVMQHVRNICFKNALYLDSDSMYSDFFYRLG